MYMLCESVLTYMVQGLGDLSVIPDFHTTQYTTLYYTSKRISSNPPTCTFTCTFTCTSTSTPPLPSPSRSPAPRWAVCPLPLWPSDQQCRTASAQLSPLWRGSSGGWSYGRAFVFLQQASYSIPIDCGHQHGLIPCDLQMPTGR